MSFLKNKYNAEIITFFGEKMASNVICGRIINYLVIVYNKHGY